MILYKCQILIDFFIIMLKKALAPYVLGKINQYRPQFSLLRLKYNFSYRSEDNFIDMKKDYYDILEIDEKANLQ